ncbi:hypothetical protein KY290_004951 [Solanum tuberosum]|uniref:Uncharacterized protein n=1 Tax=Solanum tuberosum TaxID=4113 RepID=A0ABQ7WCT2_SOLTU|nr:hypothetical protein KY289_005306 [Solanum tuberosum]KAH0778524.1 hypothetical protein KY290_004951 [Solanum tuberosum]
MRHLSPAELQSRGNVVFVILVLKITLLVTSVSHFPNFYCYPKSEAEVTLPDQFVSDDVLVEELQCLEVQEQSAISYHDLSGGNSSTTLRFTGHVNGSPVQVLVNNASTHNFIQARMANFLQLETEPTPSFSVVVGSGQRLR